MSHKKLRKAVQLSELKHKVNEQKEHFTRVNSKNETVSRAEEPDEWDE